MNDKEKHYTLKNVRTELKKVKAAQESKQAKVQELKTSIKADGKRIRELEGIYENLCHERSQRRGSRSSGFRRSRSGRSYN